MRPKASRGCCTLCGKEYTRAGMAKHLRKCLAESIDRRGDTRCYLLQVSAKYSSTYWLHLQTSADVSLKQLDSFLRRIWLECCGHMSLFHIRHHKIGMSQKLGAFVQPGMTLDYDYDMGDTTELFITVIAEYQAKVAPKKPIELLARNQQPAIACDVCGHEPAVWICPVCTWDGWLCQQCAPEHDCDAEGAFLPAANSPRAGVCAYRGE